MQDLNLVSQLEYEMQPLQKQPVRLSKLLRSYAADLLNTGLPSNIPWKRKYPAERLDLRHGLGLLLVRQVVKAHGGAMGMESAPQNGCKTILTFPKKPA